MLVSVMLKLCLTFIMLCFHYVQDIIEKFIYLGKCVFNLCMFLFKLHAHSIHVTSSMCFYRPSYTALHSMKSTTVLINLDLTVSSGDDRNILKVYVAGREVFAQPHLPRPGAYRIFL